MVPTGRCVFVLAALGLACLGLVGGVELSLDSTESGFFIKPLFGPQAQENSAQEESLFVINNPKGPVKVRAKYEPFSAEEIVPASLLQASVGNHSDILVNMVVDDMDISAHLVTRSLMQDRPYVQVLFHASQLHTDTTPVPDPHDPSRWCLQMHVQRENSELTSVCVLGRQDNVCIAELTIPPEWWGLAHVHSVAVYYSIYAVSTNLQCSSAPPANEDGTMPLLRSYVGTATLAHGELTYQEVAEDQHILLYIPQKSYYPGSKFRLPVRLQAESDLELFVVRVKARHGLKILGAEPSNSDKWRITMNLNQKKRGAMVTAFIHDKKTYTKTDRVQPIFEWIFEVEEGAGDEDPGRIILNLEYEMNSKMEEKYGSVSNRIVSRVHIQHDNIMTIVPVIKTTKLVNTAMLTGSRQEYPMQIYSLGQGGRVIDITEQTTCHSGDEEVLKVSEQCNLVFLDGSEVKGSPSVSVIAKYGRHTKFLFFKVWVPEIPLVIELSDNKLSQIKAWKAPKHKTSIRNRRGADTRTLTHPGLALEGAFPASVDNYDPAEDEEDDGNFETSCHLKFQQGIVEIYAHFSLPDETRNQYLTHRKAAFRITELVQDRLRIADTSIASLSDNVVVGLRPGRTEVQVLSQIGRVIGATEVKVGNNKVSVEQLQIHVITGISVSTSADVELPGTLVARVARQSQLTRKYQEGVLDIHVLFSDGNTIPLRHIPPSDYFLDMDTLNNHVVAFGPMYRPDTPRVIALGSGKGELLKIALELGDTCQRKKSRPLATQYVYINVDFSKDPDEALQNDGHFGIRDGQPDSDVLAKGGVAKDTKSWEVPDDSYGMGDGDPNGPQMSDGDLSPLHEAHQQPMGDQQSMTALEIGMYVLLGVFCLAIVVFLGNCMVFVVRYRRKAKPYEYSDSIANAHDWVWIGRATLERNAINTGCAQRLMPEQDFNGNQNLQLLQPGSTHTVPVVRHHHAHQSNRNSLVSTYKGSECSIRITSNPHPDANGNAPAAGQAAGQPAEPATEEPEGATAAPPAAAAVAAPAAPAAPALATPKQHTPLAPLPPLPPLPPPPVGETPHSPAIPESSSDEEMLPQPGPSEEPRRILPPACMQSADACNNNMAVSDVEWDYEAMGMTYEQLMQYFDNLKESTA